MARTRPDGEELTRRKGLTARGHGGQTPLTPGKTFKNLFEGLVLFDEVLGSSVAHAHTLGPSPPTWVGAAKPPHAGLGIVDWIQDHQDDLLVDGHPHDRSTTTARMLVPAELESRHTGQGISHFVRRESVPSTQLGGGSRRDQEPRDPDRRHAVTVERVVSPRQPTIGTTPCRDREVLASRSDLQPAFDVPIALPRPTAKGRNLMVGAPGRSRTSPPQGRSADPASGTSGGLAVHDMPYPPLDVPDDPATRRL